LALALEEIDSDLAREEEKRPRDERQAGERPLSSQTVARPFVARRGPPRH
jgi:hypothetical protein